MAKGYQANKDRQEAVSLFGKEIGKRAGFRCEWCGNKEELGIWDYRPEREPALETLELLCGRCRDLAGGRKANPVELCSIRDALWSDIPAVAEGAARVLASCKEQWAREAIEVSFIDENVKEELLGQDMRKDTPESRQVAFNAPWHAPHPQPFWQQFQ